MPDKNPLIPSKNTQTFAQMYSDLRALAGSMHNAAGSPATLQPTALVHEVYLKIAKSIDSAQMDPDHLFATAAMAMRQVCTDYARSMKAQKRGGDWQQITISSVHHKDEPELSFDLIQLEDLLQELGNYDQRQLTIVELRFFGSMTYEQIARVLNITPKRVELDWRMARSWLAMNLEGARQDDA